MSTTAATGYDIRPRPPVIPALHFFQAAVDFWVCSCGNDPCSSGHYACDPNGQLVEPDSTWWQAGGFYRCEDCLLVASAKDIDDDTGLIPAKRSDLGLTPFQKDVLRDAEKAGRSRAQEWPGTPLTHYLIAQRFELHSLKAYGFVNFVDVVKPSKVSPSETMTYTYVVVTDAGKAAL